MRLEGVYVICDALLMDIIKDVVSADRVGEVRSVCSTLLVFNVTGYIEAQRSTHVRLFDQITMYSAPVRINSWLSI